MSSKMREALMEAWELGAAENRDYKNIQEIAHRYGLEFTREEVRGMLEEGHADHCKKPHHQPVPQYEYPECICGHDKLRRMNLDN